jgi:hypothetical protein
VPFSEAFPSMYTFEDTYESEGSIMDKYAFEQAKHKYYVDDNSIEALMIPSWMQSSGYHEVVIPKNVTDKIDILFNGYPEQRKFINYYFSDMYTISEIEKITRPSNLFDGMTIIDMEKKIKSRRNVIQRSIQNGVNRIKKKLTLQEGCVSNITTGGLCNG